MFLVTRAPPRLREDEDLEDESEGRGPVKDLTDDIRNELESLPTSRTVTEEDDDDTLSYFAKLADDQENRISCILCFNQFESTY